MSVQSLLDAVHAIRVDKLGIPTLTAPERLKLAQEARSELRYVKRDFVNERDEIKSQWDSRNREEAGREQDALAPYQPLAEILDRLSSTLDRIIAAEGNGVPSIPAIGTHLFGFGQTWFIGSELQCREWQFRWEQQGLSTQMDQYLLKLKLKKDDEQRKLIQSVEEQVKKNRDIRTSLKFGIFLVVLLIFLLPALGTVGNENLYWEQAGGKGFTWVLSLGYCFIAPILFVLVSVSTFSKSIPGIFYVLTYPLTLLKMRTNDKETRQLERAVQKKTVLLDEEFNQKSKEAQAKYEQKVQALKAKYGFK